MPELALSRNWWASAALLGAALLHLVVPSAGLAQSSRPATPPSRFEAEGAEITEPAEKKSDIHASGGEFVHLPRKAGSIRWRVNVPVDGRYELLIRYRTGPADRAEVLSVNGVDRGIGFSMSSNEWVEMKTVRHLRAGENDVVLRADWGLLDIDYLRFDLQPRGRIGPLVEYPQVSPRRNSYYRGSSDPVFLIQPGGHRLLSITSQAGEVAFDTRPYPHVDDALLLRLNHEHLAKLATGSNLLTMKFDGGINVPLPIDVVDQPANAPWTIVTLNIDHGTAVVMRLPSGKIAMIDTAYAAWAEKVVLPFLEKSGIKRIDYLFITHYHDDHAGGLKLIESKFEVGQQFDYNNVRLHDTLDLDGVQTTILNSKEAGEDENLRSLALRMEYKGYVYLHGGDNYGQNQEKQLKNFPHEKLRANLFHANHHFHGSVDVDFCRVVDPELVVVSAQQAVFARGAFMSIYKEKVERYLRWVNARLKETLLTCEVGHIIVRVRDGNDWTYETTTDLAGAKLGN